MWIRSTRRKLFATFVILEHQEGHLQESDEPRHYY